MSMWAWVGISVAGVGLVLVLLQATGLASVLAIAKHLIGAVADAFGDLRRWLKVPGNKARFGCLVIGILATVNGLESWRRGTVIVQQREDYAQLKREADHELERLRGLLDSRDATIAGFVDLAKRQQDMLEQFREEGAAALADAAKAREQAATSEARYREAFDSRPVECDQALKLMARACPTLTNY